ncbi:MAG: hypothetical protein HYR95_01635 [Candidatus Colwellbacteria bacterium]|nr:hypothetical protein [Candidatus Colwellbacteria bacterium]
MADFTKWWVYIKIGEDEQLPCIHLHEDAFFMHWKLSEAYMDDDSMSLSAQNTPIVLEKGRLHVVRNLGRVRRRAGVVVCMFLRGRASKVESKPPKRWHKLSGVLSLGAALQFSLKIHKIMEQSEFN